jgi:hypothetical protein
MMFTAVVITTLLLVPSHKAWREAKREVLIRYPGYARQVSAIKTPTIEFRSGVFYDVDVGKYVYGSCVTGRSPEVRVGVVGDAAMNRDTIVHEYKHSILFRLPFSNLSLVRATKWVDRQTGQTRLQRAAKPSRAR